MAGKTNMAFIVPKSRIRRVYKIIKEIYPKKKTERIRPSLLSIAMRPRNRNIVGNKARINMALPAFTMSAFVVRQPSGQISKYMKCAEPYMCDQRDVL